MIWNWSAGPCEMLTACMVSAARERENMCATSCAGPVTCARSGLFGKPGDLIKPAACPHQSFGYLAPWFAQALRTCARAGLEEIDGVAHLG